MGAMIDWGLDDLLGIVGRLCVLTIVLWGLLMVVFGILCL